MSSDIVTDLDGVAGLSDGWPSSPDAVSALGQQHAWVMAGAQTLVDGRRLRIVAAGSGGSRAIAPLVEHPVHGRLELLGLHDIAEPLDFAGSDESAMAELVQAVIDLRRPIRLGRIPAESATIPALRHACRGRALMVVRPAPPSPYIALDPSWQEPERRIPNRRRAIRRAEARLRDRGSAIPTPQAQPRQRARQPPRSGLAHRGWRMERSTRLIPRPNTRGTIFSSIRKRRHARGDLLDRFPGNR